MFKVLLYPLYSLGLVSWLVYASATGFGGDDYDEVENVPKTVRDNPGVYRSHYINYMKYAGGK